MAALFSITFSRDSHVIEVSEGSSFLIVFTYNLLYVSAMFYLSFSATVDVFAALFLIVNNVADTLCAQIPLSSAAFLP